MYGVSMRSVEWKKKNRAKVSVTWLLTDASNTQNSNLRINTAYLFLAGFSHALSCGLKNCKRKQGKI